MTDLTFFQLFMKQPHGVPRVQVRSFAASWARKTIVDLMKWDEFYILIEGF